MTSLDPSLAARVKRWAFGDGPFDEVSIAAAFLPHTGTLIDVGAHHGSALLSFARSGWIVHAFEPDPENRAALERSIRGLPGVTIDPRAVSNTDDDMVTLYRSPVSSGISGLSAFHASHVASDEVATITLSSYCAAKGITAIDFLKVDTEGHDLFVLQGHDWRIKPRVVLCEFEDHKTISAGYRVDDLAGFLVAQGYQVIVSEWRPIVEYGSRHRWLRAYRLGDRRPNDHGWGNLLAVPDDCDADAVLDAFRQAGRRAARRRTAERVVRR